MAWEGQRGDQKINKTKQNFSQSTKSISQCFAAGQAQSGRSRCALELVSDVRMAAEVYSRAAASADQFEVVEDDCCQQSSTSVWEALTLVNFSINLFMISTFVSSSTSSLVLCSRLNTSCVRMVIFVFIGMAEDFEITLRFFICFS